MSSPVCPDCGKEMVKIKVQCEDLSGWIVGWQCECPEDVETDIVVHSGNDWTAPILHGEDDG